MFRRTLLFLFIFFPAGIASSGVQPDLPETVEAGRFSSHHAAGGTPEGWELTPAKAAGKRTVYRLVQDGDTVVLGAMSQGGSSGLMRVIRVDPKEYPVIRWRWKVMNLLESASITRKSGDDFPARLFLSFAFDPSQARLREKIYYRIAKALYGNYPFAEGLNYVWGNREPVGTVVSSPYTDRLKIVVLESGLDRLNQWVEEERNYYEDYKRVFGREPPPLYSVAVMTDTDNTGGMAVAYYGDIVFKRAAGKSVPSEPPEYDTIIESRSMSRIFPENIGAKGRLARGLGGLLLIGAAAFLLALAPRPFPLWAVAAAAGFFCGGIFMLFEAFSGWCAVRACGIKTPF
ncbi:MAG: DUF3047 domain-containing protein [Candidatus Omnitrophica bacterium]|nr:DUF3047 domain-containing protein [Candidatus Omnitrophota bacterium]